MAEIVTDPDVFIPVDQFKFHKQHLDSWCDGQMRVLVANKDFPRDMPLDTIRARLKAAARYRDAPVDVWPTGDGNLYLIFGPPGFKAYSR